MNKLFLFLAFAFYIIGIIIIIDWIVFWQYNYGGDFNELRAKYIAHFPSFLQNFFNSRYSALLFVFTFTAAGFIFLKQKYGGYKILAITSFILAFWNLFTLM